MTKWMTEQGDNVKGYSFVALPFLLLLIFALPHESISLRCDALLSPLAGSLGPGSFGIHLLLEDTLTMFLGLGLVDLQHTVILAT